VRCATAAKRSATYLLARLAGAGCRCPPWNAAWRAAATRALDAQISVEMLGWQSRKRNLAVIRGSKQALFDSCHDGMTTIGRNFALRP